MKKRSLILACLFASSLFAFSYDVESVVRFDGTGSPAGRFYFPINENYKVVAGVTSVVTTRSDQADLDLLIGINKNVPILKNVDIYFLNAVDNEETMVGRRKFKTYSLNVSKKWLYAINGNISLGAEAVLGSLKLQGEDDKIHILTEFYPVLGLTLTF